MKASEADKLINNHTPCPITPDIAEAQDILEHKIDSISDEAISKICEVRSRHCLQLCCDYCFDAAVEVLMKDFRSKYDPFILLAAGAATHEEIQSW